MIVNNVKTSQGLSTISLIILVIKFVQAECMETLTIITVNNVLKAVRYAPLQAIYLVHHAKPVYTQT